MYKASEGSRIDTFKIDEKVVTFSLAEANILKIITWYTVCPSVKIF